MCCRQQRIQLALIRFLTNQNLAKEANLSEAIHSKQIQTLNNTCQECLHHTQYDMLMMYPCDKKVWNDPTTSRQNIFVSEETKSFTNYVKTTAGHRRAEIYRQIKQGGFRTEKCTLTPHPSCDKAHNCVRTLPNNYQRYKTTKQHSLFKDVHGKFKNTVPLNSSFLIGNTINSVQRQFSTYAAFPHNFPRRVSRLSTSNCGVIQQIRNVTTISQDDIAPVTHSEIKKILEEQKIPVEQGFTCFIATCPANLRKKMKLGEIGKLYINTVTGYFVCNSCKKCGTWSELKENIMLLNTAYSQKTRKKITCLSHLEENEQNQKGLDIYSKGLDPGKVENLPEVLKDLGLKDVTTETLEKFLVRFDPADSSAVLPAFSPDKKLQGVKTISRHPTKDKIVSSRIPETNLGSLFGWNLVSSKTDTVVLTVSELDAMIVNQHTQAVALALPRGCMNLPQECLPLLEQFHRIILWFGNDLKSWDATKVFAKKLNFKRCHLIPPKENNPAPSEALQKGISLRQILKEARAVQHSSIVSFRDVRKDVFTELSHAEHVTGVKWTRYPLLTKSLKGHRRGELTIMTGPTGSGKTTFVSEYSLDLCMQGIPTLWGSFEIQNVRLMKMMLTQFARKDLTKHIDEFDEWADQFEQLPVYMMTFHGQENINRVIETMSHAVYVYDICHIIVDNLQFMMGVDMDLRTTDRFHKQDVIIAAFRKFATSMNCHVTLVIHPRKVSSEEDLSISSIFGGAKATQEADNVLIIQDNRTRTPRGRKYLQIAKNRFDGDVGIVPLYFDKESLSFAPKDKDVSNKQGNETLNENQGTQQQKTDIGEIYDIENANDDVVIENQDENLESFDYEEPELSEEDEHDESFDESMSNQL